MRSRSTIRAVLAACGAAVLLTACGGSGSSHPTAATSVPASSGPTLKVAHLIQVDTDVLVDTHGYSLYVFAPDKHRAVTCVSTCAAVWPPLFSPSASKITAGAGIRASLIGTDVDPAGGRVVTYDGWPLYTFTGDPQPGFATGQGIDNEGGLWYLIRPDGKPIIPAQ